MNLQRDFRYTIGERLKMEIMDPVHYIYKANGSYEKEFIEKARERMVVIKLQVRVLHDVKQISVKQYAMLLQTKYKCGKIAERLFAGKPQLEQLGDLSATTVNFVCCNRIEESRKLNRLDKAI